MAVKNLENEIWKDIRGYVGMYQISNLGRVKTLTDRWGKERLLTTRINNGGYVATTLGKKNFLVHRLVAMEFIPNYEDKSFVDHINTVRTDNFVNNLKWCTRSENMMNPITREKNRKSKKGVYKGENNPMYGIRKFDGDNPSSKRIVCITTNKIFNSLSEACRFYNIKGIGNLTHCCQGTQKTCGRLLDGTRLEWKYYTDYIKTQQVNLHAHDRSVDVIDL